MRDQETGGEKKMSRHFVFVFKMVSSNEREVVVSFKKRITKRVINIFEDPSCLYHWPSIGYRRCHG